VVRWWCAALCSVSVYNSEALCSVVGDGSMWLTDKWECAVAQGLDVLVAMLFGHPPVVSLMQ
jgi:hypothetical protein